MTQAPDQVASQVRARDGAAEAQVAAAIARCASGDRTALRVIYDIEAARMMRALMSDGPPGVFATTILIGRSG